MNFLRFVGPLLLATLIADWLSMWKDVASCGSMLMSCSILLIQVVFCAADVAAIYSASHVDNAVMDCLSDPQHTGDPLYVWIIPDIDLRSVTSAAKSASLYVSRRLGIQCCCSLDFPAANPIPCVFVCFMYRMRRFRAFQCFFVRSFAATKSRFATKHMLGRVESAMYLIPPSRCLYVLVTWGIGSSSGTGPCNLVLSLYGVGLPLHALISALLTTYCMAVGFDACIDPSFILLTVHPRSWFGSPSSLISYTVARIAANYVCSFFTSL